MPRSLRWLLGVAVVAAAGTFTAGPYVSAAAFIARAADLPGAPATLAAWTASRVTAPTDAIVPTRYGDVPARVYRPANGFSRTIVLVPGVHRDGIDEARLVGLAQDLAETGYGVLTVASPDLQRYRITPLVTDVIEDAVAWASGQRELAPDGRVGVLGVSFSGGLSIVAAGRERIRDRVAFLLSFGGHGNLARVMHYLCSGEVVGDLAAARSSRVVAGAENVEVHPPHDYGVAVVLLTMAERLVPPEQVGPLMAGIEGFLLASSLDMVDKPRAAAEFTRMRTYAETLPEPSQTLMRWVNDRAVRELGAKLLPVVDALADHPAMPALSPERAPAAPVAPVYLLHGADDNVIPSIETVLLGEYLQGRAPVTGLLSGLITHAEVNRAPTATEAWRLASFWRQVLSN
ncbi:MAG: alpha/beta hydrolase family protein [Vicinamibacterales bacterium]